MKKVFTFISCVLFVATMSISCSNKKAEEKTTDSIADTTAAVAAVDTTAKAAAAPTSATPVDNSAMLAAAKEAGRAKCECYKKDAASVESCIRSIISAKYAEYQGNTEFTAAMNAEYKSCIKEKATAAASKAATKAGNAAVKEGSKAISNALNKKK